MSRVVFTKLTTTWESLELPEKSREGGGCQGRAVGNGAHSRRAGIPGRWSGLCAGAVPGQLQPQGPRVLADHEACRPPGGSAAG